MKGRAAQLILASASPRRAELLRQLDLRFEVRPADVPEVVQPGEDAAAYARRIALAKARAGWEQACAAGQTTLPVLGADTDVVLDGRILGKPRDRDDALAMLAALSGREHEVFSAVALKRNAQEALALSVTRVRFATITPAQARAYWATGECEGKAGAYAIQGRAAAFVAGLQGSYSAVVGLPLLETAALLEQFGIHVLGPATA